MLRLHFNLRNSLPALLAATLTACGGSGDDTTETTTPNTSTDPPVTTSGDDTTGPGVTSSDTTDVTTTLTTATTFETTTAPTTEPVTTAGPTDPDTTNATTTPDTTDATTASDTTDATTAGTTEPDTTTGGLELVNGCDPLIAEDHTGEAEVGVASMGLAYIPKCIRISAGASVKFTSNFQSHPLVGGEVVGVTEMPDPNSPIPATSMGMELTVAFPDAGSYGYYCDAHSASGMVGAIFVE